ncbi:MAG: hypothetical protein HC824_22090, partial [Synechococcales cyanobacterium RM1_1_8]|nr:hypothetical protein [Synechococcales cyanobacterium RM1_1_8]
LAKAHDRLDQVAQASGSDDGGDRDRQQAETRHRLNCFAEGIGVLLGGIWMSIGIHGICTQGICTQGTRTQPRRPD